MKNLTSTDIQDSVLALFGSIHPLSVELTEAIRRQSKVTSVGKKRHLLNIGETNKAIYFIAQGAVRTYYIDKNGNDITSWLLFEGDLAISVYSFFSQRLSFEAMEALEDCQLLTLSYNQLSQLYLRFTEFNYIGRYLTEQYYIRSEAKANALRMLTAKERYLDLLASQPHVINRVHLGYIASFLGITQSTLSRIRATL